jgi:hypothetical protein
MAMVLRYGSGAGRLARMEAEAKLSLFALDWLYVPTVMCANTQVKTKRNVRRGCGPAMRDMQHVCALRGRGCWLNAWARGECAGWGGWSHGSAVVYTIDLIDSRDTLPESIALPSA